jgi:hypothetical protein
LDIGGANLKAADLHGRAQCVPFELWRRPADLARRLVELVADWPETDALAVTMTGELCDCFPTKRLGVEHILRTVLEAANRRPVWVWSNQEEFLSAEQALRRPLEVAAANWLATATYCAAWCGQQDGLLIDVGSTTTDLVPIVAGKPKPMGRNDLERLTSSELLYRGISRTPICAVTQHVILHGRRVGLAAELFATTRDVYLLLGRVPEDCTNVQTADGQAATIGCAHTRLARMLCADTETVTLDEARDVARQLDLLMRRELREAIWRVRARTLGGGPVCCILAGSGEFLARDTLVEAGIEVNEIISVAQRLGPDVSCASCAYAIAQLAYQRGCVE